MVVCDYIQDHIHKKNIKADETKTKRRDGLQLLPYNIIPILQGQEVFGFTFRDRKSVV